MVKMEILGNLMMKCQNNGKKQKLQGMGGRGLQNWLFVFRATCSYLDSNMWFPCILFYSFLSQFVAQPNCQQLLASRWYDEFPGWRRRHWAGKFITCVFIGLMFPLLSLCYLVGPKSRYGLFIRKPFIKFICHTTSYLTFLFLLLLASQHIVSNNPDRQGPKPTTIEWMILPWVLGKMELIPTELI